MRISVVITTYNGEKYFPEQIESILRQSRYPDEIIIVDDCSSDGTCRILEKLSPQNEIIRVFENSANLGWKKNFHNAIEKASGDIIVLCDQDDIWYENKLECIEEVFLNNNNIQLLASEFDELINGNLKKKPDRKQLLIPAASDSKLIHTYYPGCTYAFKVSLYNQIKSIWNDSIPHDAQLGIAAKLLDAMFIYGKSLIVYRRHDNNATKRSLPTKEKKGSYVSTERKYVEFAERFIQSAGDIITNLNGKKEIIRQTGEYINKRELLLQKVTIKAIFSAMPYIKYYYSPKVFLGDIFFGLK